MTPTVANIVELAQEAAKVDPVDWQNLKISPAQTYQLMASSVLEQFEHLPDESRNIIAMATITKLLVENYILHVKINTR